MRNFSTVIFCSALIISASSCKPKFIEATPKNGPITEAVFASGSIEPKDAYTLTSISDGFVTKLYVSENDLVNDGQVLVRLDNRQQNTQVSIAQNNLSYARLNASGSSPALLQLKAQIDASKVKLDADSVTLGRYKRLYATQSASKQDLDNASVAYQSSLGNYYALQENYRATAERVRQELANAQSQLQNAKAGNQYYDLTAIGAGKVYQVYKKQGDLVRRGDKVALLGNPDSIIIYLDIDEGSIGKLQLGQQVLVELNTAKGKVLEATLSKIYPHFNETAQSYKVEAKFKENHSGLISGTQLQANIITAQKDNTLLIPRSFMMPDNKVVLLKGDKTDTITISVGILSDDWVEVLKGLSATDKLVKLK